MREETSRDTEPTTTFAEWVDNASAAFRRRGHRGGKARRAVIDFLARQECCLSATEIFDGLRAEGNAVGLASIYRALEQLSRLRLVQRLDFGDAARYEPMLPSGDHHHHAICGDCGKVEPFSDSPLERALDRLGGRLGYELDGHDVVLRGSCSGCRAAN
jgi:Fur family transcriptional regulator, ferric uptake regulator